LGIGNGAVFQLVPRYFPNQRATVTGLVGAMGGIGGFFPPLLLGVLMPVQIGAKTHDFSDPTGLLSDCHRRIEIFLGSLQRVGEIINFPLTTEASGTLEAALRYFHEAAPKHSKDEEESLFPRLRQIHHPEIESALSTLDALPDDHRRADALHVEVHVLGVQCLEKGHFPPHDADRFRQAVNNLGSIYSQHIRIEDNVVFPAAKRALSSSQKSAIANEMASRRTPVS
jgi:hemerythrin-like domain-containing protein